MKTKPSMLIAAACAAFVLAGFQKAQADVTANAELVLTITLNDIFLIEADDTGVSAFDVFAIEVADVGGNTNFFGGGSPANPPGAIGSHSESESILFAGFDIDDPSFNAFDVGLMPGDTIVITQSVEAVSSTFDTTFFSQIDSDVSISFDSFGNDDQRFLFDFDVQAKLTGEFDLSTMAGSALVLAQGTEIGGLAESTVVGDDNEFILFAGPNDNYYDFFSSTTTNAVVPVSETSQPLNIPVEFSPGDNQFTISFRSSLLVNSVSVVPEVSSGLLVGGIGLVAVAAAALRRRR